LLTPLFYATPDASPDIIFDIFLVDADAIDTPGFIFMMLPSVAAATAASGFRRFRYSSCRCYCHACRLCCPTAPPRRRCRFSWLRQLILSAAAQFSPSLFSPSLRRRFADAFA